MKQTQLLVEVNIIAKLLIQCQDFWGILFPAAVLIWLAMHGVNIISTVFQCCPSLDFYYPFMVVVNNDVGDCWVGSTSTLLPMSLPSLPLSVLFFVREKAGKLHLCTVQHAHNSNLL